jgi:ribosomal protein S16
MRNTFAGLCVGGPRDGQFVVSPEPRFRITVHEAMTTRDAMIMERFAPSQQPVPVKVVTYETQEWRVGEGDFVSVWVPIGQTPRETFLALAKSHAQLKGGGET